MTRPNSVNHPTRKIDAKGGDSDQGRVSTDLYQTTDRSFPIGLPEGNNSGANLNEAVTPVVPVPAMARVLSRLRLTAQRIAPGSNLGPRGFDVMKAMINLALKERMPVTPMGTKDGLSLFMIQTSRYSLTIVLSKDSELKSTNNVIGAFDTNFKGTKIDGVYLDSKYRGRGLGTVLYLGAIQVLGKLQSDTSFGVMACRAWRSVSKYYKVSVVDEATKKSVPYTWGENAIPIVDGYPINKGPNLGRTFYFRTVK